MTDFKNIDILIYKKKGDIKMKAFRLFLVVAFVMELVYTIIAGSNEGWNIFPLIIESITSFTWLGQFNLDFSFYLVISSLWIFWRYNLSLKGLVLACFGLVGGILFLAPFLFVISFKGNGSVKELLLGENN